MILSGRDLKWYIESGKLKIDPISDKNFQQNGIDFVLKKMERRFDNFFLGTTLEYIEMPDDLMAFVELRSTWAREGYFLPPTIIDAGFKGTITLEILFFGKGTVYYPVGQRFAHFIFAKLTNPTEPYKGKYQNQIGITEAIMDEK